MGTFSLTEKLHNGQKMKRVISKIVNKNSISETVNSIGSQRTLRKKFTLQDLINEPALSEWNLIDMVMPYPTNGIGFKVRQSNWPTGKHYKLTEIQQTDKSTVKVLGHLYHNDKMLCKNPIVVKEAMLKGGWQLDLANSSVTLDNGAHYSAEDMKNFHEEQKLRV